MAEVVEAAAVGNGHAEQQWWRWVVESSAWTVDGGGSGRRSALERLAMVRVEEFWRYDLVSNRLTDVGVDCSPQAVPISRTGIPVTSTTRYSPISIMLPACWWPCAGCRSRAGFFDALVDQHTASFVSLLAKQDMVHT